MSQGLQVIGAGFGRTGTDSTRQALEILGYSCQHMKVLLGSPNAVQGFWAQAMQEKFGPPLMEPSQWEKLAEAKDWNGQGFENKYTACVDFPFCPFYKELLKANPEAKVLLTVRDNADKWYNSAYETIHAFHRNSGLLAWILSTVTRKPIFDVMARVWTGIMQGTMDHRESAIAIYNQHIEEVKRTVPPDQLLVFNVKQGWEPLCTFLGKPVPDVPFPNVNSSAVMKKRVRFLKAAEAVTNVVVPVLVGGLAYFVYSMV
eukprot:m.10324 g.10324  ORF g.10324 m.10324 type:complete len:259 (+) comp5545_c0_seq1:104-880(+)